MARYLVRSPLRMNGHHFQPGERLEMAPGQARELVESAVLQAEEQAADLPVDSSPGDGLQAVLARLDPGCPDHWTRDNKPRTEVLGRMLGRVVTATERDRLWRTREVQS